MNHRGLFLVKTLHASVEREEEDLSEYAAFRKHTLQLLRNYFRLAMDHSHMPSVMKAQPVRAKVSHCKVHSLEDDMIFLHDLGRCMEQELREDELRLVAVTVFMEHTFEESARLLGYCEKQVRRSYIDALNKLTRAFCEREFLDVPRLMMGKKKPMSRARGLDLEASAAV